MGEGLRNELNICTRDICLFYLEHINAQSLLITFKFTISHHCTGIPYFSEQSEQSQHIGNGNSEVLMT